MTPSKSKENYILKANSIIQGYVVQKQEELDIHNEDLIVEVEVKEGKVKVGENEEQKTLTFSSMEFDILNIILKKMQESIFYTQIENYKSFNPFSLTFKEIKQALGLKGNSYVQEIHSAFLSLKSKDFLLKNFIHPDRTDENGNFLKYKVWYSSIITEFGYRNPQNIKVDNHKYLTGSDYIDIELSSLFKWLLTKPKEKQYNFNEYSKFKEFAKIKNPFLTEEQIKDIFEEQKKDQLRKVSYTTINHSKTKQIRSNYGKKLFEELYSRISYQTKSKKTVNYGRFKLTINDFNLMWGKEETGMSRINEFFKRRNNWKQIKDFLESEDSLKIQNLQYQSYNRDYFIEFTFDPNTP